MRIGEEGRCVTAVCWKGVAEVFGWGWLACLDVCYRIALCWLQCLHRRSYPITGSDFICAPHSCNIINHWAVTISVPPKAAVHDAIRYVIRFGNTAVSLFIHLFCAVVPTVCLITRLLLNNFLFPHMSEFWNGSKPCPHNHSLRSRSTHQWHWWRRIKHAITRF